MKMVNDVLAKVRETTKQAKSIIDKAGMRPVDEYIAKKIGQCQNEIAELSLYMEGIEQVITTNELIVNELKIQMQQFMERVGSVENNKQEAEQILSKIRGKVVVLCDQLQ